MADTARTTRLQARLAAWYAEHDAGEPPAPTALIPIFDREALEHLLVVRPAVASFHFGLPKPADVEAIKAAGIKLIASATTPQEAREVEAGGVDAVIAQGWEAGGHRGTFAPPYGEGQIGTLALVPQVVDAVGVPVIAAGGIADGRGIAAALMLGASAVQLGTAFLSCPEAAVHPLHRQALAEGGGARLDRRYPGLSAADQPGLATDEGHLGARLGRVPAHVVGRPGLWAQSGHAGGRSGRYAGARGDGAAFLGHLKRIASGCSPPVSD